MTETDRLRLRLLGSRPVDTVFAYVGALLVAAFGGVLRFVNLGQPDTLVFDETYYVKQGWSLLEYGHERRVDPALVGEDVTPGVDELFAAGTPDVFGPTADFVVHPPVGKWVIAAGQWLIGVENPLSWRFGVAVLGTLSIFILALAARRLFSSTLLGLSAGLLLAVDGQHLVHSRTGLLDASVMFFALGGFAALLIDRDRSREILARKVGAHLDAGGSPDGGIMRYGPWLGWHPWRWVAAVSLGLCIGTKWSGLYFLAIFGLMTVFWDMGARRAAGVKRWWWGAMLRDAPQAAVTMVGTAALAYVASWAGWFSSNGGWNRRWAEDHPATGLARFVPDALRSLWDYHEKMMTFHVGLHTPHTYQSNPWSWMLQSRPTSFFYKGSTLGDPGCTVEACSRAILNLGNPAIWWTATLALPILLFMWALARDWRAGAILAGFVGGYLPWFLYQERTIFTFYSVAFVPFVVLAVVYLLALVLGRGDASLRRRRIGLGVWATFMVLAIALFAFFWPIYVAEIVPRDVWNLRMWFRSWV
ncbi:MAG: phospholipid carrier-dependent glycosyltransferase [Mobilicoccus sp.]|nr:phospholipid carrier-dependent glycosyltransferase [Mobilicoccus sp.]